MSPVGETPRARSPLDGPSWLAGSKADLLYDIGARLQRARVPRGTAIAYADWRRDPLACCARARRLLGARPLAVRSSRIDEDRPGASQAGRYRSFIGVHPRRLRTAIADVFASYGSPRRADQVLVQHALSGVEQALVAANRAPGDGAPYDAVSLARSSSSAAITRGDVPAETWYVARDGAHEPPSPAVAAALAVLREIEGLVGDRPFEVELAQTGDALWLLQVRPLALDGAAIGDLAAERGRARRALEKASAIRFEARPLFGMMPDWNPAELLGEHPRPLALSLFDALIARGTWWRARVALGYRRPRTSRLVRAIGGRPYVDVRASLESLLPAALSDALAERLIAAWSDRLRQEPALHDRIEFEVAVSCRELDAEERLRATGLAARERAQVIDALLPITRRAIEIERLESLVALFERRAEAPATRLAATPAALRAFLYATRRDFALPFALAARCDFVGAALLRSAVRRGALAPERLDDLRSATRTMAGRLVAAAERDAGWQRRFGDLRPGTFEVAARSYGEWTEAMREVGGAGRSATRRRPSGFALRAPELRALGLLLRDAKLGLDPESLVVAASLAAQAREVGKLALAQAVAALLQGIARFAARHGLDRDRVGWLDLASVLAARLDSGRIRIAARRHEREGALRLPPLLERGDDVNCVRHPETMPTFLGSGRVSAPPIQVGPSSRPADVARGRVVAIESADPGYDWLFTRAPAALVTAFGGPHSHMALRCAELGCPAILGMGVERFRRLVAAPVIRIDLDRRIVEAERAPC